MHLDQECKLWCQAHATGLVTKLLTMLVTWLKYFDQCTSTILAMAVYGIVRPVSEFKYDRILSNFKSAKQTSPCVMSFVDKER